MFILVDVRGDGGRHTAYIGEGVVGSDDAAPSIGAEFDLLSRFVLLGRCHGFCDQTNLIFFFAERCCTILPTSCDRLRVVMSNASAVSTTTTLSNPTTATNLPGACTKFPRDS